MANQNWMTSEKPIQLKSRPIQIGLSPPTTPSIPIYCISNISSLNMSLSERTPLLPQFASPSNAQVDSAKKVAFSAGEALAALKAGMSLSPYLTPCVSLADLRCSLMHTGKMPTHQQFDKLIAKALDSDLLNLGVGSGRTGRLSEEGARVVKAFRDVLEAVRNVGEEKNGSLSSILRDGKSSSPRHVVLIFAFLFLPIS